MSKFQTYGQEKRMIFYNENEEQITKQAFIEARDYRNNLDLYFENDTAIIGILITRRGFGHLNKKTFSNLKSYLTELSGMQIDSTENIVINYLTAYPKKEDDTKSKSSWNVLDRNYPRKLHKIADIEQFWISSPKIDNLQYYYPNRINWIEDKNNFFERVFFPYIVKYGNYLLIKPNGHYYYHLGEHSKYRVWDQAKKYFR